MEDFVMKRLFSILGVMTLIGAGMIFYGCASGEDANDEGSVTSSSSTILSTNGSATVPITGGIIQLSTSQGTAQVSIPKDAVADGTEITLEVDNNPKATDGDLYPTNIAFIFTSSDTVFDQPITLQIPYSEDDIPDGYSEDDIILYYWDGTEYVETECTINENNNMLTANIYEMVDSETNKQAMFRLAPQQQNIKLYLRVNVVKIPSYTKHDDIDEDDKSSVGSYFDPQNTRLLFYNGNIYITLKLENTKGADGFLSDSTTISSPIDLRTFQDIIEDIVEGQMIDGKFVECYNDIEIAWAYEITIYQKGIINKAVWYSSNGVLKKTHTIYLINSYVVPAFQKEIQNDCLFNIEPHIDGNAFGDVAKDLSIYDEYLAKLFSGEGQVFHLGSIDDLGLDLNKEYYAKIAGYPGYTNIVGTIAHMYKRKARFKTATKKPSQTTDILPSVDVSIFSEPPYQTSDIIDIKGSVIYNSGINDIWSSYIWKLDGKVVSNSGATYSYSNISGGDHTIILEVSNYWGISNSDSVSFTVADAPTINTPPEVTAPSIDNTTPKTDDTISCDGGVYSDLDGDPEFRRHYGWYENGNYISRQIEKSLSLTLDGLDEGDEITCKIRVSDGEDYSEWVLSNNKAVIVECTSSSHCGSNETCSSGQCVSCTSHYKKKCYVGDVYYYDSCDNREEKYDDCGSDETCSNGVCVSEAYTWYEFQGHSYAITEVSVTWIEAEAEAVAAGGHLVAIGSAEENQWVLDTFSDLVAEGALWIGYTDADQEGVWEWSNGESLQYENWYYGEPNNAGGNEDYTRMYTYKESPCTPGTWCDLRNDDGTLIGVIEKAAAE